MSVPVSGMGAMGGHMPAAVDALPHDPVPPPRADAEEQPAAAAAPPPEPEVAPSASGGVLKKGVEFVKNHPRVCVAAGCVLSTVAAIAFVPAALGFGASGIVGGSYAAGMMSAAAAANGGTVAAGSTVAILQSVGAAGAATSTYVAAGATAAAVGAGGTAAAEKVTAGHKRQPQAANVIIPVAHPVQAEAEPVAAAEANQVEEAAAPAAPAAAGAAVDAEAVAAAVPDAAASGVSFEDAMIVHAIAPAAAAGEQQNGAAANDSGSGVHGHAVAAPLPSAPVAPTIGGPAGALPSCVMCQDAPRDCHIGCAHLCLCTTCASRVSLCPICRHHITHRQKMIFS